MKAVTREVTDCDKGCRICNKFNFNYSCWKDIDSFGENCSRFDRNYTIKTITDFEETDE